MTTRRNFLKNSTMLAAGLGISPLLASAAPTVSHKEETINGRVNIAVIGVGMGCRDLQGALTDNPWVHCVGMCDVNKVRLDEQIVRFKKDFPNQTTSIKAYSDFREVLANKDIDGVIIATPDHWHPYIFAEALKAGKAIYVEKPVGNSIPECHSMMDFQKKYKGVVTTGLWQTSQRYFLAANEILKSGVLGDVYKVQLWLCQSTDPRPAVADSPVPSTLDYNMWLGPAPERPFNNYRFRGWRGFWDYGGGQQTDWGVHWIDSAFDGLKALGLCDREYPEAVFSTAYKDPTSFNETPSCQTTIFQYKNFHIEWAQQVAHLYNRDQGVAWVGSKATLVCNREGYELIPEKNREGELLTDRAQLVGKFEDGGIEAHATNWCKCILNKSIETNSPIEKGAFATILAHMANISYLTGTRVVYDPQARKYPDGGVHNFDGKAYPMETHGFADLCGWDVESVGPDGVTLALESTPLTKFLYPFDFTLLVNYNLEGNKAAISLTVINEGDKPMPFSFGYHPYFMASALENVDFDIKCATCSENAKGEQPAAPEKITLTRKEGADNTIRLLTGVQFPMTFTDKGNGHKVTVDADETFDKGVLWQQDAENFVCMEPWNGWANSVNEEGRHEVLDVDEAMTSEWSITIEKV